jgi:glycosyltransferase involved in cell wall biosynthesis
MAFKAPDGGAAENVFQLTSALTASGWVVELAGPLESQIYERLEPSVRIHRLPIRPGYSALLDNAAALKGLRTILDGGDFDLLHAHSAQSGVLARMARLAGGPPVVYTPHCFTFLGHPARFRSAIGLTIERMLAPLTAAFIDVSSYERTSALRLHVGRGRQHHVVRNGAPAPEGVEPDEELCSFRGDGPLIAVIASLRPQKRVDVFLRALPSVLAANPGVKAAVVGNGSEQAALTRLAEELHLPETGRFMFAPFRGPAERYLRCTDVYVLPSGWESLPIGILEALACGVPQVASDVGGVAESVGEDTGILVPPADTVALAEALTMLIRDPELRRRMAEASRVRHDSLFGVGRMVSESLEVYGQVLSAVG